MLTDCNNKNVILVNPDDEAIGVWEKIAAHRFGMLHRAFSIFIFRQQNNNTELLLQQRAFDKYHSAGLWTNTCCGHPEPQDSTLLAAATVRLKEEMGIATHLQEVARFHYIAQFANGLIENEIDHVIVGTYNGEIVANYNEIAAYAWIDLLSLQKDLYINPAKYTVWFTKALQLILQQQTIIFKQLFIE